MQIDWQSLLEYVRERDPTLVTELRGISYEEIKAVEDERAIRLPSNYVSFLRIMGEESGGLTFFGPTQIHASSKLLEMPSSEGYAGGRFFKVSFEADELSLAFLAPSWT